MKKICLLIVAFCLLALAGCAPQNAATQGGSSSGAYAVVTDDRGTVVTLPEKPQRVVVLSTSLLNFAAAVDGNLAGDRRSKRKMRPCRQSIKLCRMSARSIT